MSKIIDFTKLPVGTKVWDYLYGWVTLVKFDKGLTYSIICKLNNDTMAYTAEGYELVSHIRPRLFLSEFKIPESAYKPPLPDLKVDDKVFVWNENDTGKLMHRRHFYRFDDDGKICCIKDGCTSWSVERDSDIVRWDNWKLPDEEDM